MSQPLPGIMNLARTAWVPEYADYMAVLADWAEERGHADSQKLRTMAAAAPQWGPGKTAAIVSRVALATNFPTYAQHLGFA